MIAKAVMETRFTRFMGGRRFDTIMRRVYVGAISGHQHAVQPVEQGVDLRLSTVGMRRYRHKLHIHMTAHGAQIHVIDRLQTVNVILHRCRYPEARASPLVCAVA